MKRLAMFFALLFAAGVSAQHNVVRVFRIPALHMVEAEPQIGSGLTVRVQNSGSTLATRGGGIIIFNCSTDMTCSWSGNTFTLTAGTSIQGVALGGTGADMSSTGGSGHVVRQDSVGAAFTTSAIAQSDIAEKMGFVDLTDIAATFGTGTTGFKGTLTSPAENDYLCVNASANIVNCLSGTSVNAQTGTTYTVLTGDRGKLVTHTNASAIAVTLPQAGSAGFGSSWFAYFENRGAGTVTITPTTSTVDGAASIALTTNQGVLIASDNTNYFTMRGIGGSGAPGGSGTELQARLDASTFQAVTGSSFSGSAVTLADTLTLSGASDDFAFTGSGNHSVTSSSSGNFNITTSNASAAITIRTADSSSATPGLVTARGGVYSGTSTLSGAAIALAGGGQTGAATGGAGGAASLRGGASAGNASATGGDAEVASGGGSAATPALPGRLRILQAAIEGSGVTSGDVVCISADRTVTACATSSTWIAGVAITSANPIEFLMTGVVTVTLQGSQTYAAGDFVCMSATVAGAGNTTGTTPCVTVATIGRVWVGATAATAQVLVGVRQ